MNNDSNNNKKTLGDFPGADPVVLRLHLPVLGGMDSIPGGEVKIPHASWLKKTKHKTEAIKNPVKTFYKWSTSGLPWWLSGEGSACQCKRRGFDPQAGKIPCRRAAKSRATTIEPGGRHS